MSSPSPCIKVCSLDEVRRICVGCGRTLDEIANWSHLDEVQRLAVAARLPERLAGLGLTFESQTSQAGAPSRVMPAR